MLGHRSVSLPMFPDQEIWGSFLESWVLESPSNSILHKEGEGGMERRLFPASLGREKMCSLATSHPKCQRGASRLTGQGKPTCLRLDLKHKSACTYSLHREAAHTHGAWGMSGTVDCSPRAILVQTRTGVKGGFVCVTSAEGPSEPITLDLQAGASAGRVAGASCCSWPRPPVCVAPLWSCLCYSVCTAAVLLSSLPRAGRSEMVNQKMGPESCLLIPGCPDHSTCPQGLLSAHFHSWAGPCQVNTQQRRDSASEVCKPRPESRSASGRCLSWVNCLISKLFIACKTMYKHSHSLVSLSDWFQDCTDTKLLRLSSPLHKMA